MAAAVAAVLAELVSAPARQIASAHALAAASQWKVETARKSRVLAPTMAPAHRDAVATARGVRARGARHPPDPVSILDITFRLTGRG